MKSYSNPNVMPADFTPTERHIVIGRGRVVKQHPANQKFDKMVQGIAAEYSAAACKAEKGNVLSKLIVEIHKDLEGFVKKDPVTGRWLLVEESLARTTAAQALRNYLCTSYRSSKQFKSKRRLQQIKEAQGTMQSMSMASMMMQLQRQQCMSQPQEEEEEDNTRCVSPYCCSSSSEDDDSSSCCSSQSQYLVSSSRSAVAVTVTPSDSPVLRDTFSILYAAFGKSVASPTDDPFAPTPLMTSSFFDESLSVLEPTPLSQDIDMTLTPSSLDADLMSCLML